MSSVPKEYKEWRALAEAAGWRIEQGKKHEKWIDAEGRLVTVKPVGKQLRDDVDRRALLNFRAHLRRAGLPV